MRSLIRNFALTTIPARAIKWALTLNNDTTMKRLYVILCMVALLAITSLAAEKAARKSTIHLRSGEFVTGVITARDNQMVEIVTDDQMKYAKAPKLETDASANDYGQAEPVLTSAIRINGMPQVNIHPYHFAPGSHTLSLPTGFLLVLGYTTDEVKFRDAGLSGADEAIDWLFY